MTMSHSDENKMKTIFLGALIISLYKMRGSDTYLHWYAYTFIPEDTTVTVLFQKRHNQY